MATELTALSIANAIKEAARDGKDEWLPDGSGRGGGRLMLRATPKGGLWYFRYTLVSGQRDSLPIGAFAKPGRTKDETTGSAYSLAEARDKAREYAGLLKNPKTRNIRDHLKVLAEAASNERQRLLDEEHRAQKVAAAGEHTVGRLCEIYCDHLARIGKDSADKVRADLSRHVLSKPIANRAAKELSKSEVASLIRSLVETGKVRIPGLIRSYLSSAYALAIAAEGDATAPAELVKFAIETNPVQGVKAIPVRQRKRYLSNTELHYFLKRVDAKADLINDALWLCLYAGGQRPKQLSLALVNNYISEDGELTIFDKKGRRKEAREHMLPLAELARNRVEKLLERADALGTQWLFSATGQNPLDLGDISFRVTEISREMVDARESAEPFQLKDLRRTIETTLASLKVSKDIRAQLLSHGLSGVQDRVYDKYDYADEKRAALVKLEHHLEALKKRPVKAAERFSQRERGRDVDTSDGSSIVSV